MIKEAIQMYRHYSVVNKSSTQSLLKAYPL